MNAFLDEVADTAEEVAAEQRKVARDARSMQRRRDQGASWVQLLDHEGGRTGVLGRLRDSARKLAVAIGRVSQGFAEGLRAEGLSHRAIARRLGVTHQRISTLLNHRADSSGRRV